LRPTITQEADRLVVSVEGTATAAGATAFDVLSKAPGVFVDHEGNIQLNGKTGVTVMIDDKPTYLSATDLRAMLEGMSAEEIRTIDIITNPSAKYDAEGTSGILNINLKKNKRNGVNGSLHAGTRYNFKQWGYSYGGTVNHKAGNWNSFLSFDGNRRVGGREATFTRVFYGDNQTTYFDQVATGNWEREGPPFVRLGTDFAISDQHSVGFNARYVNRSGLQDFLTETFIGHESRQPVLFIDADNYGAVELENISGNVHYLGEFDTAGTTLAVDVDYVRIRNHDAGRFYNYFTVLDSGYTTQDFLSTDVPSGFDIYAAKVDFTKALNQHVKLEIGVKASEVTSDNNARFYINNGPEPVLDSQRTNHFNYVEHIYAAYVNANGTLSKRFTLQAGLRAEQTRSTGNAITTGQITKRRYTDWFPSIFLQQHVTDAYQLNYNYSRRISRPDYENLNPVIAYRDPYTWFQGNPFLRSEYTHSFGLSQTFKKTYNLALEYNVIKDASAELLRIDPNASTTVYYTGNVDYAQTATATLLVPVGILKRWQTQNTVVVSYSHWDLRAYDQPLVNEQLYFMIQSNHTVSLPLNFTLELNAGYEGPQAFGLYIVHSRHWLEAGLKKSFFKKSFDVTLNATDILKGQRLMFTTDIGENVNDFDQYFRNRSVGLTVRYRFSKGQKIDGQRRENQLEELQRTGN
ncbi:MAG TPA: outer membrane beta-barrel family protein, partial [Chitinophagales bacterium]|nr:outer membrane beta-barrel family protein [Chitinophagales bacterium]